MIAVFGLIALAAIMLMSSEPAEAYTVVGTETWVTPRNLNQDLIIAPGGVLNLQSEVYMQLVATGQFEVRVLPGGTLNMDGGTITRDPMWPPVYYDFWVDQGSTASFLNSRIEYAGGNSMGVYIMTTGLTMNGLSVTDGEFAGIMYENPSQGFTMTNCYIADNGQVGVYIVSSAATDYVFNFQGGTRILNNVVVGVYTEPLTNTNLAMSFQNSQITGHEAGIYIDSVVNGDVILDFQSSDITFNNDRANLYVNQISNGDLTITATDTHFDFSQFGYGIVVGSMSGPLGSNLTISSYLSFFNDNGGSGIYINSVSNGYILFDMIDTSVNGNGWMSGGHGLYVPPVAPGNQLTFGAVRTSFSNNAWSGILISGANPGSMSINLDGCDLLINGESGMDVGFVSGGDLTLGVRNSVVEGNGVDAMYVRGVNGGSVTIVIDNNRFNNSYAGIYVTGNFETAAGSGDTFTFTFSNNWLVSGLGSYGVYLGGYIQYFDETTITISGNYFSGQETRTYGAFFNRFIMGDINYWHNFTLNVNGNDFLGLDEAAVYPNDFLSGFRTVNININNNYLEDGDFDYEFGFIFWSIFGNINYDTSLNVVSNGNVYVSMTVFPFYMHAEEFRHVNMDFSSNIVDGNGITQFGIFLDGLDYSATGQSSDLVLNVDNNEFYDMGDGIGFVVGAWGAPFFKSVDMTFTNNHFNGSGSGSFAFGVYFFGDIYYTNSEVSSFNLLMDNNEFIELTDTAIYFERTISSYSNVNLAFTNNLFENRVNIWMSYGIRFNSGAPYFTNLGMASSLTLTFDSNSFFDLNSDAVAIWSTIYGFRNVTFVVERNIFENRIGSYMDFGINIWGGITYDTNDYDNFYYFSLRENTFRDLSQDGIVFGSWSPTYGYRHIDIQIHDNTFENVMDPNNMAHGIFWYYEVFYTSSIYDSSFNIDVTGNYFADLTNDAITFEYNMGWDFRWFSNASVNIQDNTFVNTMGNYMDYGIALRSIAWESTDLDNSLTITIVNNTFDSLNNYGVYFYDGSGFEFEGYRNVAVVITDNRFHNTLGNWMDYGIYLQGFWFWDDSYDSYLNILIADNNMSDLTTYGIYVGGETYFYRNVDIDILDNVFSDIYNNFDVAIYFPNSIYYTTTYDSDFSLNIMRNQFRDLTSYGIYFGTDVWDFRNASLTIQDNEFYNTISNWMDHGVYMQGIYYNDNSFDNNFDFNFINNRYENLDQFGFRMSSIYGYRHVTFDITDNFFSDIYNSFNYGLYFTSSIGYTTDFDGDFTFTFLRNTFHDLNSRGVYFSSVIYDFRTTTLTIDSNDFVNTIGDWLNYGLHMPDIYYDVNDDSYLYIDITNNNFENLSYAGFRIGELGYFRHTLINIMGNYFSDIYGGFDYGVYFSDDIYAEILDVNSEIVITCTGNEVRNLYYWGYGAYFSSIYNFRSFTVLIDNNDFISTQSGRTGYGVFFDGIYFDDEMYDAFFDLDITNNNFENLTYEGVGMNSIENYRFVTIDINNNYFSDEFNDFDYGIYFEDSVYVDSTDYYAEFTLTITGNEFRNLYAWGYGAYFYEFYNYRLAVITIDNNDFICTQPNRLGYGVGIEYVYYDTYSHDTHFYLNATNNVFQNLNDYGLTLDEIGGYSLRHLQQLPYRYLAGQ
jgi:hypothetical protein